MLLAAFRFLRQERWDIDTGINNSSQTLPPMSIPSYPPLAVAAVRGGDQQWKAPFPVASTEHLHWLGKEEKKTQYKVCWDL